MELSLVSGELEFHVSVPSEAATVIHQQMARMVTEASQNALAEAMLKQLGRILGKLLDPDLRPPTEKQIEFATLLSRKFAVQIPRDALIYRFEMSDFIDRYAPRLKGEGIAQPWKDDDDGRAASVAPHVPTLRRLRR